MRERYTPDNYLIMYFEEKKIINVADGLEEKIKRITHEHGSFDVPAWEYEAVKTEEVSNPSDGRNARGNYVAGEVLKLLRDLNVRVEETGFYFQKILTSLQDTEGVAILNAFGFYPSTAAELEELKNRVRLSDWESKLYGK